MKITTKDEVLTYLMHRIEKKGNDYRKTSSYDDMRTVKYGLSTNNQLTK